MTEQYNFTLSEWQTTKATPFTVGELKKKINRLPADTPVYMVFDKTSEFAWDEEHDRWRNAVPVAYATKEDTLIETFDGFDKETVLLLEIENP